MARTIQSPGVEIKEIDQAIRPVVPAGTNILVAGFADKGPTDEIIQVTSRSELLIFMVKQQFLQNYTYQVQLMLY